jgi:Protein of unknown function (DUF2695)
MPSPEEAARRRALKQALRQTERDQIRSTLPLSPAQMRSLFDFVDQQLAEVDCDGTLQKTLVFLEKRRLPVDAVIMWLRNAGGQCDCEVLANAEEKFLLAFPSSNS